MSYILNCEGLNKYLTNIHYNDIHGRQTYVFRFDNDYGALVVNNGGPTWDVVVINYFGKNNNHYILDFTTDVAEDVIVNVSDIGVKNILRQIKGL